ncbi:MAG: hypothetical protein ABI266_10395 [Ginsengibacter sp.]
MKHKILFFSFILFLSLTSIGQANTENSPAKNDVITMNNGEQKTGQVLEVLDNEIKFRYVNESITYNLKKSEISKITFASGRVEQFSAQGSEKGSGSGIPAKSSDYQNKIAVLPFSYIYGQMEGAREMSLKIQQECNSLISQNAKTMNVQDVQTTNALLIKSGINNTNIQGFTMDELCRILNVEYVVQGIVTVNEAAATTNYNTQKNTDYSKNKVTTSSSQSGTTQKDYKTDVTLNIFDNNGKQVFSQKHNTFWTGVNAYNSTLKYLLKRTPIYGK